MSTSDAWHETQYGGGGGAGASGGYHSHAHHTEHPHDGGYRHAIASSSASVHDLSGSGSNGLGAGGHGGYIEDEREGKHEYSAGGGGGGGGGGDGSGILDAAGSLHILKHEHEHELDLHGHGPGHGGHGHHAHSSHSSEQTPGTGSSSEPRIKRQVGRPRIETTKVPAEITDKLERTRALGRERQRRKRERDRQSAANNSPSTYAGGLQVMSGGGATPGESVEGQFKRPRGASPLSGRADSPAQGSRSLRSNKAYQQSPSSSSLSFEPLNMITTDGGYIESPVHHVKGGSGMLSQRGARSGGGGGGAFDQGGYGGGNGGNGGRSLVYQVSPSRTAISTPSMDGPLPTRTPTELAGPNPLEQLSPTLNPSLTGGAGGGADSLGAGTLADAAAPSSHGAYFASNLIHALATNRDLRDITLRGLALSEAELLADAMRDEVAMAYDRFRLAQQRAIAHEAAVAHGQSLTRYDGGVNYPVSNGLAPGSAEFPPRSAPASLSRSESWTAGLGHVPSSPRHGHGRRSEAGFGMRDREDDYGLGNNGPIVRPASAMAASQTPHLGMDMPPPNHSYNQDDRVNGLNIHFGQHSSSSSRHSPKMGPPHDASAHHYAWQRTPTGESFNRGHSHSHSHAETYESNGNTSMINTIGASPVLLAPATPGTATLRPIRNLPGETSPYKARPDRSGIYESADGVGAAGQGAAGGAVGEVGGGGYEGNGGQHDDGMMYPHIPGGGYTASPYLGAGQHAGHSNHISSVMG